MKDYYALLGIEQKATKAEIKKNYRVLATKYHPDKNDDPQAASTFIAITEAYDTLSNRKARAQYDLQRWQALKNKAAEKESFRTVVRPRESTRTRRNKAQRKRSISYHSSKTTIKRTGFLLLECIYILSRYVLHLVGISIFAVILKSAVEQVLSGFESSLLTGIIICAFALFLAWAMLKMALNFFQEVRIDLTLFSIYYKVTQQKAIFCFLPVFMTSLFLYFIILHLF